MTTAVRPADHFPSGALATAWSRIWRSRRLVERNILVYRHQWIIIVSGVFEPIFYLLGIGLGLGAIVESVPLPDGRTVAYAAYVAPALVATAAMSGAVFETIFNVFFKLNYAKTYDGVLATPMGITEIAIGEGGVDQGEEGQVATIDVDDVKAERERLDQAGVEVGTVLELHGAMRLLDVFDPDGNRLQLAEELS